MEETPMASRMIKALYICYFGIQEPLVQTQVLPYLRELAKVDGMKMSLVTFEQKSKAKKLQEHSNAIDLKNALAQQGIDWYWVRYHKWPPVVSTAWDILRGTIFTWTFIRRNKIDLVHARVQVPMLMAALARSLSSHKPKLLFDIRGFFPEEYTDAGIWPKNGWLYRAAKGNERWLIRKADGFVVLTERARKILFPESSHTGADKLGRPVEVIPCCIDLDRFREANQGAVRRLREETGARDRSVIAYVGSFGGWYLSDEMLDIFSAARMLDPTVFPLVLTQRDIDRVTSNIKKKGFADADFLVRSVAPTEVDRYLNMSRLAISLIKPCYSKLASSPTKNAEYLACGLPILANRGIGDVDELIETERVGVLLNGLTNDDYVEALQEMEKLLSEPGTADRCRAVARKRFDLSTIGGVRYRSLYKRIIGVE
jgi:glycosyltransferase involved in cell wall biosynthesis